MSFFTERDDEFIYQTVWWTDLGGYWRGYVGYLNPERQFSPETPRLHHDRRLSATYTDGRNPTIHLTGFDCVHPGDLNIGPNGEFGANMSSGNGYVVWTKESVFKHLKEAVADLK